MVPGKSRFEGEPQIADIIGRRAMALEQETMMSAIRRPDDAAIVVAQVDPGNRAGRYCQACRGGLRGNFAANGILDLIDRARPISSIRVPVGARTCKRNAPASTAGKKSCPRNGIKRQTTLRKTPGRSRRTPGDWPTAIPTSADNGRANGQTLARNDLDNLTNGRAHGLTTAGSAPWPRYCACR